MMNIEKQIIKRMEDCGYTRLEAIASMNLGERSKAAARALANRARRKELMEYGMDFETACLVVNKENEQRWQMEQHLHNEQWESNMSNLYTYDEDGFCDGFTNW